MSDTAFNQGLDLLGGAFTFKLEAFQRIATLPDGLWFALLVVGLAGLSLAVGQSVILFINQVKPGRFIFSLLLNAALFTSGFLFLTLSTWLICLLPGGASVSLLSLIKVLGLGYAPLLFGFLGALPYFGYPLSNGLGVWNLLAVVVGFAAVARVEAGTAIFYVVVGWGVKQLLEGTIGQPIAQLGSRLADRVAGLIWLATVKNCENGLPSAAGQPHQ
ncbi:MAG: hypothetical protein HC881_03340 [Leptolyngbyaceae cyanobacterium SL_7_1]|nr:hypothetical protein [Leptolyngbyaceae cyanobacterium SL_7_1]